MRSWILKRQLPHPLYLLIIAKVFVRLFHKTLIIFAIAGSRIEPKVLWMVIVAQVFGCMKLALCFLLALLFFSPLVYPHFSLLRIVLCYVVPLVGDGDCQLLVAWRSLLPVNRPHFTLSHQNILHFTTYK